MPNRNTRKKSNERMLDWTSAREGLHSAKERLYEAGEKTQEFVENNPWKAIAISAAVGAGVALGVAALLGSGSNKKRSVLDILRDFI